MYVRRCAIKIDLRRIMTCDFLNENVQENLRYNLYKEKSIDLTFAYWKILNFRKIYD